MPEIILRLRVWDNSSPAGVDATWCKTVQVHFAPTIADDVELWDGGPLAPVARCWFRSDGYMVVSVVDMIINAPNPGAATGDGRLQWIPLGWKAPREHPCALLQTAGWKVLADD